MKIKPVEFTPPPSYPDKYSDEAKRALVYARPRRWVGKSVTAALSATVALGISGCSNNTTMGTAPMPTAVETEELEPVTIGEPIPAPVENEKDEFATLGAIPTPVSLDLYVPLFEYGEGTGSIGCVAVTAPVFMSEEEALAILTAAFEEAGLRLSEPAAALGNAAIPRPNLNTGNTEQSWSNLDVSGTLGLGFGEPVPVKFVSVSAMKDWEKKTYLADGTEIGNSVEIYNIQDAARILADNNPGLVVFYDPMVMVGPSELEQMDGETDEDYWLRVDTDYEERFENAKRESEELLLNQAEAFVEWCASKGLI